MKINKGTIKNINKKLIAGLLAVTLTTSLVGCTVSRGMQAAVTAKGEKTYLNAQYNEMGNWKVVVFELNNDEFCYLVEKVTKAGISNYYNIFGGQRLYTEGNENSDINVVLESSLTDYLIAYDKVQSEYTEQELKDILEQIRENYKTQKEKQLVIGD